MCTAAINLTSKALDEIDDATVLLSAKAVMTLFIQTMEVSLAVPQLLQYITDYKTGLGVFCNCSGCVCAQHL
jgi:hypothetical protein